MFAVALIAAVRQKRPPAFSTCLMNGIILTVFAVVYVSLDLWLAFSGNLATTILWLVLLKIRGNLDEQCVTGDSNERLNKPQEAEAHNAKADFCFRG